jgi:hypothetical protein
VLTVLDMRAAIGALIEKWRRLEHVLGLGICIATLGTIGFETRSDSAAIGTVSQRYLSPLRGSAGQILISSGVLIAVKYVAVEPVGEFALNVSTVPWQYTMCSLL